MLQVLHEDNHIIVVIKPFNVLSQADETNDEDMLTLIKAYLKEKYNKPGNVYLGLIHRLDRPAGGVMVFAKTDKAASRLSEAMREGEFEKKYYAVLCGTPRERTDTLVNYLVKDSATNSVKVVPMGTEGAKRAELKYTVRDFDEDISLADIELATGRSHQIRVQFANIKCPLFGDVRYGGDKLAKGHNMALWSYLIGFTHPVTKVKMVFKAAPPVTSVPWNAFKQLDAIFNDLYSGEDCVRLSTEIESKTAKFKWVRKHFTE